MSKSSYPANPAQAFSNAEAMAKRLKLSVPKFCTLAKVFPSTVYRWRTNIQSFNTNAYLKLLIAFEKAKKSRRRKK